MDERIAAYIDELSRPGIPYISNSHGTLRELYARYGKQVIDQLLEEYWESLRTEKTNKQWQVPSGTL